MKYLFKLVVVATLLNLIAANDLASVENQVLMELMNLRQDPSDPIIMPNIDPQLPKIEKLRKLHEEGKIPEGSDAFLSMQQMCVKYGFAYEEHTVTTSDGYILTLGRIPGFANEHVIPGKKPAVLLQHSLSNNMMQWVMNAHDITHAFVLARNGYDVWLGNNRGTRFSQGHKTLNAQKDREYWYFSWEEMGTHDLPAFIDYICEKSYVDGVSYIGHSEGTTQLLAGGSLMPEYFNKKIKVALLLAPPAAMYYSPNLALRFLSHPSVMSVVSNAAHSVGLLNWVPYNQWVSTPGSKFCSLLNGTFCELIYMAGQGYTVARGDRMDRTDVVLAQVPADASAYNFEHYGQLFRCKSEGPEFKRFDYGEEKNMKVYGQKHPPHYNLKNIGFPTAIFYGTYDDMADPKDVAWLHEQIKDAVVHYEELPFGHGSFQLAKDMSYFTKTGMGILNKYNNVAEWKNMEGFNKMMLAGSHATTQLQQLGMDMLRFKSVAQVPESNSLVLLI